MYWLSTIQHYYSTAERLVILDLVALLDMGHINTYDRYLREYAKFPKITIHAIRPNVFEFDSVYNAEH